MSFRVTSEDTLPYEPASVILDDSQPPPAGSTRRGYFAGRTFSEEMKVSEFAKSPSFGSQKVRFQNINCS